MSNDNTYAAAIGAASNAATIAYDSSATKKQNRRMIEFWNMQNDYNHPRSQMSRLQEAGLNPNLIYGDSVSGATGKADSPGTPQRPDNIDPLSGLGAFQDIKRTSAQADLVQQQLQTEMERKRLTSNQADKAYFDAANSNYGDTSNEFTQQSLQAIKIKNDSMKRDVIRKDIENTIKDRTKASEVERIFWQAENAKNIHDGRTLQNELLQLQRSFLRLGLDRNSPWYAKIFGSIINNVNNK